MSMSIATRTGDDGTTSLLYGRRVPKNHPRVVAYGSVDELSAALGLARACPEAPDAEFLHTTQLELVGLMGELATADEDHERFLASKLQRIVPRHLERLDQAVAEIEAGGITFRGWSMPGITLYNGFLNQARTLCRRAERDLITVRDSGGAVRPILLHYLNRLSDVLWLFARLEEMRHEEPE